MLRRFLQAKIHRVRVTESNLHYEGSCAIDEALLEAAGIKEFQFIELYNVTNGERWGTYAITAPRGSGMICPNGASARKALVGDILIICSYLDLNEIEVDAHQPAIVLVDERNHQRAYAAGHTPR